MSLTLTIPDEILTTIKLPKSKLDVELQKEMAFALYQRGLLSMGVARRLAELSKWDFIEGLTEREIPRHYYDTDADEDIAYARCHQ